MMETALEAGLDIQRSRNATLRGKALSKPQLTDLTARLDALNVTPAYVPAPWNKDVLYAPASVKAAFLEIKVPESGEDVDFVFAKTAEISDTETLDVEVCDCYDNEPGAASLFPPDHPVLLHVKRTSGKLVPLASLKYTCPPGCASGIPLEAIRERAFLTLTPDEAGWPEVLNAETSREFLEWARYVAHPDGFSVPSYHLVGYADIAQQSMGPSHPVAGGGKPWQSCRADAEGIRGTIITVGELRSSWLNTEKPPQCARCGRAEAEAGLLRAIVPTCTFHKFCEDCIMSEIGDYGARTEEAERVRSLPLRDGLRFYTGCFGCARGAEFCVKAVPFK